MLASSPPHQASQPAQAQLLSRCLLLALLLHLWLALAVGSRPGPQAAGQGAWGGLSVTLQGAGGLEPDDPTESTRWRDDGPPGDAPTARYGGQLRSQRAPLSSGPGAQQIGRWQAQAPDPARPVDENQAAPSEERSADAIQPTSTPERLDTTPTAPPVEPTTAVLRAPASLELPARPQRLETLTPPRPLAPVDIGRAAPLAKLEPPPERPPAEVAEVPEASTTAVPMPVPPPPPPPAPRLLQASPAEPRQRVKVEPLALPSLPRTFTPLPSVRSLDLPREPSEPQVQAAPPAPTPPTPAAPTPAAVAAEPVAAAARPPAAPEAAASPSPAPKPPPTAAPAPAAPAPAAPARGDPLADPAPGPRAAVGSPLAGARVGHDVATAPSASASAPPQPPPLNLSLPRSGALAVRRSAGLLELLPGVPDTRSKMEKAVDEAQRDDCRQAHSEKGLLAAAPLLVDSLRGKGCKW